MLRLRLLSAASTHQRPYRRVLQIALIANTVMFAVELVSGLRADSVSLLADAVDFAGDAANYGLSVAVLSMAPIWRSRAALLAHLHVVGLSCRHRSLRPPRRAGERKSYTDTA